MHNTCEMHNHPWLGHANGVENLRGNFEIVNDFVAIFMEV